jgi:methyl-accepting chemotaxis protein
MESKEVRQTLKDLSEALANINTTSSEFPKEVGQILENIKQTSENISELTETAKRYPSWVLFGNPPPRLGEIKK